MKRSIRSGAVSVRTGTITLVLGILTVAATALAGFVVLLFVAG